MTHPLAKAGLVALVLYIALLLVLSFGGVVWEMVR